MAIRVAFIGAGSIGFTRELTRDILSVPELGDTEFRFTDIDRKNLEMVTALCEKDIEANGLGARITATTDRRRALEGADYVINVVRVGGLEAFRTDIEIPLKYGIDQCVGDTLAPGGIMYGQRNIPCILDFCKDIREVAADDVLFLNYANPNAMNTWAAIEYGGVETLGLCHGVTHTWHQIAEVLGAKDPREVEATAAGINHQTWFIDIRYKGRRVTAERLLKAFENHPTYSRTEKVRIDILRRFGCYSTESNGHLSEYVPWYRKRPKEIRRWIDLSSWSGGETGGYLRVCSENRDYFTKNFSRMLKEDAPPISPEERTTEHGSYIIEARETGRVYRGHFNVKNHGTISNLPADCIVEVPGYVDSYGVNIPRVGELPAACAATCRASIDVQRMAVRAAVEGDVTLLKQAMLHDPLTAAVCNPPEIWRMTDEMLVAQAKWLPQYKREVPRARKRLAESKPLGTKKWRGAARVEKPAAAGRRRKKAR